MFKQHQTPSCPGTRKANVHAWSSEQRRSLNGHCCIFLWHWKQEDCGKQNKSLSIIEPLSLETCGSDTNRWDFKWLQVTSAGLLRLGDFCCSNFQLGCPHTTLSPLGCDARSQGEAQLVISLHMDQRKDWYKRIGLFITLVSSKNWVPLIPIDHHFPDLLGRFWCSIYGQTQ